MTRSEIGLQGSLPCVMVVSRRVSNASLPRQVSPSRYTLHRNFDAIFEKFDSGFRVVCFKVSVLLRAVGGSVKVQSCYYHTGGWERKGGASFPWTKCEISHRLGVS